MADIDSIICPQCKVGFAPDTATCPICKIPLVSEDESIDELSETPAPIILKDDLSSLEKLRTADIDWIHHLQDRLAEAGIPHCIEQSNPPRMSFSIYVRSRDLPQAKDIDDEVFAMEVPESDEMSRVEELDFWSCPGCGNRLGETDLKCISCGLVLSPPEGWKCSNCKKMVEANMAVCPHCGCDIDPKG